MKNRYLSLVILLLFFISFISAQEILSFEEVLREYKIPESRVIGGYTLNTSEEIPFYEFDYVWDERERLFLLKDRFIHYDTKVPAVHMYIEDWEKYGHLFVIPVDDNFLRNLRIGGRNKLIGYELVLNDSSVYFIPSYKITYTRKQWSGLLGFLHLGKSEIVNITDKIPAIEMGPVFEAKPIEPIEIGMREKFWGMWTKSIQLNNGECIENGGRMIEIGYSKEDEKITHSCNTKSLPEWIYYYKEKGEYPSFLNSTEWLITPVSGMVFSQSSYSESYPGCCLPMQNYQDLKESNFSGIII